MSDNVNPGSDGEFTTLRTEEWNAYRVYVAGLERRVADYEAEELRREEYNRDRALTEASEGKRTQKLRRSVARIRLLYFGGWVSYILIGGLIILLTVATLPTAVPQAMAGDFMGWLPLVVLFAALVVPLMMSGYQRARRPLAVFLTGLFGPLIIWSLILLGDYAGIASILPVTPAAT